MKRTFLIYIACVLAATAAKAQACALNDSTDAWGKNLAGQFQAFRASDYIYPERQITQHLWLWGAGRANVLDTYLSPLEYAGPNLSVLHATERTARWGKGRVSTYSLYTGNFAYLHSPTDDGREWDGELTAAGGWHYNWQPLPRLRLAVGGVAEISGGFTYNTRGSNNPAQGRLGLSLAASGVAEYSFSFFKKAATARLQADAQMLGVQFAPVYGQSYYEIFSLGHSNGVVHFTQPANCPSVRLQALVVLPVLGARLTLGYVADVRQSSLGDLKRHAWRNSFMLGYTRHLRILR